MLRNNPRRLLTHGALALSAGIFLGARLEFRALWLVALGLSCLLLALLHSGKKPVWPGFLLSCFFAGLSLCAYCAHPALPPEGKYQVTATVTGEAKIREEDGRIALYIRDVTLMGEGGEYALDKLYWTYWPQEEIAVPLDGQTVTFTGKFYHPDGQENPFGFDFRMYLLQKGAVAGISGGEDLVATPEGQTQPRDWMLRARRWIATRMQTLLQDQAPLATALLIGETEGMPEEMREGFRKAGVAHVLSVSGLHAMLIMGLIIRIMDKLQAPPKLILGITGVFLAFYSALTGSNAPILRAVLLVAYQLYARTVRRRGDHLTAWSVGLMIILFLQPLQLFSAGFQMSFGAVLGMILLYDALQVHFMRIRNERLRKVVASYAVTLCATVGAALPVIYTYNSFSLMGLLVNPLICLMTELLMLADIVLLLASCISLPLAQKMGVLIAHLSRFTVEGVGLAGEISWSAVHVPSFPWYLAAAIVLCLILCTRYVKFTALKRVLLGGGALTVACTVMLLNANHDVRYIQLAMGNADAAVIEDGQKTIVIDTGEYGGDLSSYLLATGRRADHLILTHLHTDHALGLEYLLSENVQIGTIYLTTEAFKTEVSQRVLDLLLQSQEKGIKMQLLSAGDQIRTKRVTIDVLWPKEGSGHALKDANDCAAALLIDLDGASILHMSDLTGAYENYAAVPVDILRAAHHGSADSTRERFLSVVQPAVCLISGDSPSEKTLSRLANVSTMVYDTGTHGALFITVREGQYFVQGYLQ